jgi:dimethylhistidine N-methyltransferase
MNAPLQASAQVDADLARYREVRAAMLELAAPLSAEDLQAQSMPDASPGKWHLAHTSWFFEVMMLDGRDGSNSDPEHGRLFNSYYEALGERVARPERGLMTRPSLDTVLAYRREIDRRMVALLSGGLTSGRDRYLLELGLHHDQQHQELFLMDLLHLMSRSPLDPAAYDAEPRAAPREPARPGWTDFEGGAVPIGDDAPGFAFDNERPAHMRQLQPYRLANDLVTNAAWIAFIEDGGYERAELWLADGWATVQAQGWTAPSYWRREADGWSTMSLTGRHPVDPAAPVRHVSFYEADAFARWVGARLPTEAEWETAARRAPDAFSNLFGEVWQWTSDAYAPYPGFRPTEGLAAEYNGKFMANQLVLRGGAFATPPRHARVSYRNFYYPHQRWMFSGVRLARDVAPDERALMDGFERDLVEGLSQPQKAVSPKWFYDAAGSALFEQITRLPEYYPTRQEAALLRAEAGRLADFIGPEAALVEFGSGASEKTRIVLDAARALKAYQPIDISDSALDAAADALRRDYPGLRIEPLLADFLNLETLPVIEGVARRVGFFPGSTIGNLTTTEAIDFMRAVRGALGESARFVLGVDLVKSPDVLIAAYDDAAGVTATFNKNLLVRANRELAADFDLDGFAHLALWNGAEERMEMHLSARYDQAVHVAGRRFDFLTGETIHTESSHKFTRSSLEALCASSGWRVQDILISPSPSVALALLTA